MSENIATDYESQSAEQIVPTLTEAVQYVGSGGVTSVNGYTGVVVLDAEDVGAASTTDLATKANKDNGTLTGTTTAENITISGDLTVDSVDVETSITVPTPSDNTDAANKAYVDAQVATKANSANATLTGTAHAENIIVDGDLTVDSLDVLESITVPTPTDNNDAVNKSYVNTRLGGLTLLALTQAEYDALSSYDANTLYVIKVA